MNILVSIIVITYNSAKTVVETLDSILEQTYLNLELIISDDGSNDDTIAICTNWVNLNSDRFVHIEIISPNINLGIPANCNRGINKSKGEWIKIIAGDDILEKELITNYIEHIKLSKEVYFISSKIAVYKNTFQENDFKIILPSNTTLEEFNNLVPHYQHRALLKKNIINAPSMLINKKILLSLGGFDERIKLLEDIPLWLKATKSGFKIVILNFVGVKYRLNAGSVQINLKLFNPDFLKDCLIFLDYYLKQDFTKTEYLKYKLRIKTLLDMEKYGFNNNNVFSKILFKAINLLLN